MAPSNENVPVPNEEDQPAPISANGLVSNGTQTEPPLDMFSASHLDLWKRSQEGVLDGGKVQLMAFLSTSLEWDTVAHEQLTEEHLTFVLNTLCATLSCEEPSRICQFLEQTLSRDQGFQQKLPSLLETLNADDTCKVDMTLSLVEACCRFPTAIFWDFSDTALSALLKNENLAEVKDKLTKVREEFDAKRPTLLAGYRTNGAQCSFRELSVLPTPEDLDEETPYLRPNITEGSYGTIHDYLDIHFRLLREDYLAPLRTGVQKYRKVVAERGKVQGSKVLRSIENVHFFLDVRIEKETSRKSNLRPDQRVFRLPHAYWLSIDWEHSSRLMEGSLIGVSSNNFVTVVFATVAQRMPKLLKRGYLVLQFFNEDECRALDPTVNVNLIESSSAYFEAYRHNLQVLQSMNETSMPLASYMVEGDQQLRTPAFLQSRNDKFDFAPLLRCNEPNEKGDASELPTSMKINGTQTQILRPTTWPSQEATILNARQYKAMKSALSRELCLVQGPPGTGKTFVALKMVEMMLYNHLTDKPILVVCYTNHALDQFLEGILKFTDSIVRIGGNCKSVKLDPYLLCSLRRSQENNKIVRTEQNTLKSIRAALRATEALLGKLTGKIIFSDDTELRLSPAESNEVYLNVPKLVSQYRKWQRSSEPHDNARRDPNFLSDQDRGELAMEDLLDRPDILADELDSEREKAIHMQVGPHNGHREPHSVIQELHLRFNVDGGSNLSSAERWRFYRHFHWLRAEELARNYLEDCKKHTISCVNFVPALRAQQALQDKAYNELEAAIDCLRERAEELRNEHRHQLLAIDEAQCAATYDVIANRCAVVGMTTTGAAKYNTLVRRLQPEIVVVEEAAEILEAHLLASITPSVQQLLLIGDHQQLQPSTTVHALATKFGMQVSMFERLINNKLDFVQLREQHRMRDSFRQLLVPTIYKDYISHYSISNYPNTRGMASNLFFMSHSHPEIADRESHSKSNLFEAEFVVRLAVHLRQQGYAPDEVTVLATYRGQVAAIESAVRDFNEKNEFTAMQDQEIVEIVHNRKLTRVVRVPEVPFLPVSPLEGVRMTTVDNYQGEESPIIILSLVRSNEKSKIGFLSRDNRICVALSRAKIGLYAIGDLSLLARVSPTWEKVCAILKEKNCIGDGIELRCEMHSKRIVVQEPSDFDRFPEGGCEKICQARLPCGHDCLRRCHGADPFHKGDFRCSEQCRKMLSCGHPCRRACGDDCSNCIVNVSKRLNCGHAVTISCSQPRRQVQCPSACGRRLSCGHICPLPCGKRCEPCKTQITILARCQHTVTLLCKDRNRSKCMKLIEKPLTSCGHSLFLPCSDSQKPIRCTQIRSMRCSKGHVFDTVCYEATSERRADAICSRAVDVTLSCGHSMKVRCSSISWCNAESIRRCSACRRGIPCRTNDIRCQLGCKPVVSTPFSPKAQPRANVPFIVTRARDTTCNERMTCGHTCKVVRRNGRCTKHKCYENCGKTLFCGHHCPDPCHTQCAPCCQPVKSECPHQRVSDVSCMLSLYDRCNSSAEHCPHMSACGKTCGSCTCRCLRGCRKIPPCGNPSHRCIGICGETCICAVCDERALVRRPCNAREPHSKVRYYRLPCGHCCDVRWLDRKMDSHHDMLRFPICPSCKIQIRFSRRYRYPLTNISLTMSRLVQKVFQNLTGNGRNMQSLLVRSGNSIPRDMCAVLQGRSVSDYEVNFVRCLLQITQGNEVDIWRTLTFHQQVLIDYSNMLKAQNAERRGHPTGAGPNVVLPKIPLTADNWRICQRNHFFQGQMSQICDKCSRRNRVPPAHNH